tara:strand:- start:1383 stop:3179 length:1797 start_codon:yes stop_codon:yes gene_type:complete
MADKTFFGRLQTLFSTNAIVRRVGTKKLKVIDVNKIQANSGLSTNRLIDRYSKLHGSTSHATYNQNQTFQQQRIPLFTDYESMDEDSIISSALDIYADESTIKNEFDQVLSISCADEDVHKILHNLFYDVLNIEFNLWPWVRNLCKYGDMYLKLDITESLGVTNAQPLSTYEMVREEGMDPENPEHVQFVHDVSMGGGTGLMGAKTQLENYEVAHFRLLSDTNFLPYGKSMLEGARKVWKQLTLMEDAMLIHRIMRAPEKRIFKIDIGNIPPAEVDNYMQQVINKMKKVPYIDEQTGQYNLNFNMQNMLEDFYLPVRGGQSGTEIDSLSGMEFTGIEDVDYLKNKIFAGLKVPKAFLGYDETTEGKATLAAEDVRFARTIERIQRIVVSELTKIAIVHLYSQGYTDEKLVDFELKLTNSSTIYQQEKLNLWTEKINLADSMKDNKMLSEEWIYKNIFNMSEKEFADERDNVIGDIKQAFRKSQIEMEGNDPARTEEVLGTPHSLAVLDGEQEQEPADPKINASADIGRPPEGTKYNTQDHVRGADPLGGKTMSRDYRNRDRTIKHTHKESFASITANMNKINKSSLLSENNLLDDESL